MRRLLGRPLSLVALVLWLLIPAFLPGRTSILVLIALYAPIVIGLSLLAGFAGQVSLGQAAFYGLGAYVTGVLTVHAGWPPLMTIPVAVVTTALVAYLLGVPVLMLRGHYLVLATLGLNIIVIVLLRQLRDVTGGASGLIGIEPIRVGGRALVGDQFYFYAASALMASAAWLSSNLASTRIGRALLAIRSSETAAATLGIDSSRYKAQVFAWSAALAAAAGALYAHWLGFVSPSPFEFTFSVILLSMAVVGGIASIPGAVIGAAVVVLVREELQGALAGFGGGGEEREIVVFGLLLLGVVLVAPQGLWPRLAGAVAGVRARASVPSRPRSLDLAEVSRGDAPILSIEGVTRRFGGLTAVEQLSFSVRPGEVFAIIGPNGAGKTTVLNLISGVLTPDEGSITLSGEPVARIPAHRIANLGVARTFQTPQLFPLLSLLDNVKVGAHRHLRAGFLRSSLGLSAGEERAVAEQALGALDLVGIASLADKQVGTLSFASQRLVEVARAMASRPDVLLLDEPASGLSAEEREELARLIRRIAAHGVAVVLVEHNVRLVADLADRILVIHHGERLAMDEPEAVLADPLVVEAYLGTQEARTPTSLPSPGAGEGPPLFRASGLNASYGAVHVLHDVGFEVREGRIVGILGRNGAGKTTLMRAVAGLLPAAGEVQLDGRPVLGLAAERLVAAGLSLVPERRELLDTMTVLDNLLLGAYRRRAEDAAIDPEPVFRLFPPLRERASDHARALSGGQQQMLAIARALMARPRLLLLDEPLLGLAPQVVTTIIEAIVRLRDEGMGILLVEQNAAVVLPMVDHAYVLENGRVVAEGTGPELSGSDRLRSAFLGADIGGDRPGAREAVGSGGSGVEGTTRKEVGR